MTRVGIAGIGFMGWIHYLAYGRLGGVEVAAICTRDERKRRGDWTMIRGNFGPPGEQVDTSAMACYETLEQLIADPEIDLVDICLPPHLHASASIAALEGGKHVFCEKPIALTMAECDAMVEAARRHDRLLMIGHVLPFFPEYAQVLRWFREETYGAVRGGTFRRVISDPLWIDGFYDPARVGGPLVDLHIHDAHFIRLLFGMPKQLTSSGRMRGEVVESCHTLFRFDNPDHVVHAECGVIDQQGRPFTHGFEITFERATVAYDFAVEGDQGVTSKPLTVFPADGGVERPSLESGDEITPFEQEIAEVLRSIESGSSSDILGGDLARDALVLCHGQTESVRSGQPWSS